MPPSLLAERTETASLPLIDIAGLFASEPGRRLTVAEQIGAACRDSGFFCIRNHGIKPSLQAKVFTQTRAFFAQPAAVKEALNKCHSKANRGYEALRGQVLEAGAPADLKEGFYLGLELADDDPRVRSARFNHGPNQWPTALPGFRPVMERYYAAMNALASRLMGGLALSLGLPEDYFAAFCQDSMSTLRLLHYPPQPVHAAPGEKGCGAHTDFGGLTLLLQDEHPGLQVWDRHTESWLHADPIPGCYVVNLGDMIARWTNDRYRSTLHRVVNHSGHERYSVPFFFSGNPDHRVECIPTCLAPGETPHYPAVSVEAHHRQMYRRTYGQ